jgi:hypothetical protein
MRIALRLTASRRSKVSRGTPLPELPSFLIQAVLPVALLKAPTTAGQAAAAAECGMSQPEP